MRNWYGLLGLLVVGLAVTAAAALLAIGLTQPS